MNTADFINRIDQILKFHDLSASVFADTIGVQRSSISHLLAGRNKPSLEFVLKVVASFPEVDLYWLLFGKGSFPKKAKVSPDMQVESKVVVKSEVPGDTIPRTQAIDKVIIFYSDGSFKSYSEKGS
ncbi:DNA-binding XRE family transcriptional regulator [Arenibacter echinorum]|uniref:DNA-binding XRE family transcriptional regulator n=1 Tax=Arenibacter echinorum TaxID=440515 RepID=A0A327RFS7_9FLAO|nr:helix-turn-helix transcriptional regulator [Arenibacter echinorum]RAJ12667.1 DNA-binding XRE family transcriptional regulator [Arenibacter echinorum]